MSKLTTIELKEIISRTFDQPFERLIERRFAENNYAKYLFIKECREKGMSIAIIAKHLSISDAAVCRYLNDYKPDFYVKELFYAKYIEQRKKYTL